MRYNEFEYRLEDFEEDSTEPSEALSGRFEVRVWPFGQAGLEGPSWTFKSYSEAYGFVEAMHNNFSEYAIFSLD
jgi:hypothetical protein